jgi:glycosyltransferase involved in cell wall biosynthesis
MKLKNQTPRKEKIRASDPVRRNPGSRSGPKKNTAAESTGTVAETRSITLPPHDLGLECKAAEKRLHPVPPLPVASARNGEPGTACCHQARPDQARIMRDVVNARVRTVASSVLPSEARVLVISKGDDDLLHLNGARGLHFPQTQNGVYAGHHPANAADAVSHLELLRQQGADYLLIPASAFWWLDFYLGFTRHLEANYRVLVYQERTCIIFDLRPGQPLTSSLELTRKKVVEGNGPTRSTGQPPASTGPAPSWPSQCASCAITARSLRFLGETHLLCSTAAPTVFLPLKAEPRTLELDVESCFDVNVALRIASVPGVASQDTEGSVGVTYFDKNGLKVPSESGDLVQQPGLEPHKSLKPAGEAHYVCIRLFPPPRSQKVRLSFRSCCPVGELKVSNKVLTARHWRGISVVIGVYLGEKEIGPLLDSLSQQTLAPECFEVIFVINGPRDRSAQLIKDWADRHPLLKVQVLHEKRPSPGQARNAGISRARFSHVTFVDCDDTISPDYLAKFYELLSPDSVVLSHIADVDQDGRIDHDNPSNLQLVRAIETKEDITPLSIVSIATMSACKAVPTFFCRQTPFMAHLKSGEDICFFSEIYSRFPVKFFPPSDPKRCVYFRRVRQGSVSRRSPSFEFSVTERLEVITCLNRSLKRSPSGQTAKYIKAFIDAQADFMARFLFNAPDRFEAYKTSVSSRNLFYFPWVRVNRGAASCLVFSYCFPPAIDPSGIVAAKRIVEMGQACDVICNDMSAVRKCDANLFQLVTSYVGRLEQLKCPAHFADWKAIELFAGLAVEKAADLERIKRKSYLRVYSRALWAGSHFAAALFKTRRPEIQWTAEFSDPLLLDVNGRERAGDLEVQWLAREGIQNRVRELGYDLNFADRRIFYWAEVLPYLFADQVIFTNPNQLKYMLSYCPTAQLRAEVERKAVIKPHPIPHKWVNGADRPYHVDHRCRNLAYFGSFYANRTLGGVFESIARLRSEERERLRLYLFTSQIAETQEQVEARGLSDAVLVLPELDYLTFLQGLNDFDVLIVNDVYKGSSAGVNPYLPSKLSDYASSRAEILALYEEGSELSRRPEPTYRCRIREEGKLAAELVQILRSILKRKSRSAVSRWRLAS